MPAPPADKVPSIDPAAYRPPRAAPPEGIHLLRVPTPFPVGDVNCYLLRDPITLIDCGPHTARARHALEEGLRQHDLTIADIQQVVLTHFHMDHAGLAATIKHASGCPVYALGPDAHIVESWDRLIDGRNQEYAEGLRLAGVPNEILARIDEQGRDVDAVMRPCPDVQDLTAAAPLTIDSRRFEVVPTPGHTDGSHLLVSDDAVFTGDTLLPHITPNAIHIRRAEWGALSTYIQTLQRLNQRSFEGRVALPGHGIPFTALEKIIQRGLLHHEQRARQVASLLAGAPQSVWNVAQQLFPSMRPGDLFLAISEAFGHLEHLLQQRHAQRDEADGALRYRAA